MKFNFNLKAFLAKIWDKIRHFNIQDCRVSFVKGMQSLQASGRALFVVIILAIALMLLVCLAVFFATVKGPEKVLVPQLEGKELTQALMEMQVKELYPKIQLRYSEEESGIILAQNPDSGSIVKAGTRVNLTVSRGAVVSEVGEYVGLKYDDVKLDLTTMFTGSSRALIVLNEPVYKADLSDAGTILEQDPPAGTKISDPVKVQLVVSRGPSFENTRVPRYVGKTIQEMLSLLPSTKLVFDFKAHKASKDEKEGTVVRQQEITEEFVPNYSRVEVEFAMPSKSEDDLVYGIFETSLPDYPYPVSMTVEAVQKDGMRFNIATLDHTGGSFSIPYAVESGTELILRVAEKEARRMTVN